MDKPSQKFTIDAEGLFQDYEQDTDKTFLHYWRTISEETQQKKGHKLKWQRRSKERIYIGLHSNIYITNVLCTGTYNFLTSPTLSEKYMFVLWQQLC